VETFYPTVFCLLKFRLMLAYLNVVYRGMVNTVVYWNFSWQYRLCVSTWQCDGLRDSWKAIKTVKNCPKWAI